MDYVALGMRIREKRKEKGWKITELAEKAELGDDYLGKIERGQGIASLATLVNIANALNVGLDSLVGKDLSGATEYLNEDINKVIKKMDEKNRRRFLEFIYYTAPFFNRDNS